MLQNIKNKIINLIKKSPKTPIIETWDVTKEKLLSGYSDLDIRQNGSRHNTKLQTIHTVLDNYHRSIRRNDHYPYGPKVDEMVYRITRDVMRSTVAFDIIGVQPLTAPVSFINVPDSDEPFAKPSKPHRLKGRFIIDESLDSGTQTAIEQSITAEFIAEMDCDLLLILAQHAGKPTPIFETSQVEGKYIGDICAALTPVIMRHANLITHNTDHNNIWCVVPSNLLPLLKQSDFFMKKETSIKSASTKYVGKLNNTIDIYENPWIREDHPVIVGCHVDDINSSMIWCPYEQIIPYNTVDPHTFEPIMSFKSRYGVYLPNNKSNYLSSIDVSQLIEILTIRV